MPEQEWLSLPDAARVLGYGRSRMYALKGELGAEPDPVTGLLRVSRDAVGRFRDAPPPGRRPRGGPDRTGGDPAAVLERIRALESDVRRLGRTAPATPGGEDSATWRRRALVAEHALGELAGATAMYEAALDAESKARTLEERAAAVRGEARRSLLALLRAYRHAVQMVSAPVDVYDVTGGDR